MYDSMGSHLGTMGAQNNDALNIGSQYYQIDSAERQNALNQAAAMERAKYQAQIDELVANITGETSKYQADKTLEGTKYGSDIGLKQAQYTADQALQEAYAQAATDRYKADKTYESDMAKIESAKAEDDSMDEELTLDEAFGVLVTDMKSGNVRFDTWDQLEDYLVENGYNIKKVQELLSTYATRYPTPQSVTGR